MKNITLFMHFITLLGLAAVFALSSNAQVILDEDFSNSFPPPGWILLDEDGDGYDWLQASSGDFNLDAQKGTHYAASQSWDGDPLTPDNWLITPQLDMDTIYQLEFWAAGNWFENTGEYLEVYVSDSTTALSDFVSVWSSYFPNPEEWEKIVINLSTYKNDSIYIAFRHHNISDEWVIGVDNVSVSNLLFNDIAITKHYVGEYSMLPVTQTNVNLWGEIQSYGADTQNNVHMNVSTTGFDENSDTVPQFVPYDNDVFNVNYQPDPIINNIVLILTANQDENDEYPDDNVIEDSLTITSYTFARDKNTGVGVWANSGVNYSYANLFVLPNADTVVSIGIATPGVSSVGTPLTAALYTIDGADTIEVATSDTYEITAADTTPADSLPVVFEIPFESPYPAQAGEELLAVIHHTTANSNDYFMLFADKMPNAGNSLVQLGGSGGWSNLGTFGFFGAAVLRLNVCNLTPQPLEQSMCKEDSVALSMPVFCARSAVSYQWSPADVLDNDTVPNPVAFPDTTTTFTVVVSDMYDTDTTMLTLTVLEDIPVADFDTAASGLTVQFFDQSTDGESYQWDFGGTGSGDPTIADPIFTYDEAGTYVVELTVTNACGDHTVQKEITVVGTHIPSPVWTETLDVFPNPTEGQFRVKMDIPFASPLIQRVTDAKGQVIYNKEVSRVSGAYENTIDLSGYAPGIYYIQIITTEGSAHRKIMRY